MPSYSSAPLTPTPYPREGEGAGGLASTHPHTQHTPSRPHCGQLLRQPPQHGRELLLDGLHEIT